MSTLLETLLTRDQRNHALMADFETARKAAHAANPASAMNELERARVGVSHTGGPRFDRVWSCIRAVDDDEAMRAADEAAADAEWIEWTGNLGCPVPPGTLIAIRERDGDERDICRPELHRWLHSGQDGLGVDEFDRSLDTVAYRVVV